MSTQHENARKLREVASQLRDMHDVVAPMVRIALNSLATVVERIADRMEEQA